MNDNFDFDYFGKAYILIREKEGNKKPKNDRVGIIECPKCKGKLHYSISSYNNHVWGKCETENCLAWMQ